MSDLLKVSQGGSTHVARKMSEFNLLSMRGDLSSLAAMLGGDKFTTIVLRTKTGNIYLIGKPTVGKNAGKWVVRNGRRKKEQLLTNGEMFYGRVKVGEKFIFGYGNTDSVTEILGIVGGRNDLRVKNKPEAKLYQDFVELYNRVGV
jgi:hypothetical protein